MRIRVGDGASAAIQLDTGTVQGLSMLYCDSSTLPVSPTGSWASRTGITRPLPTTSR